MSQYVDTADILPAPEVMRAVSLGHLARQATGMCQFSTIEPDVAAVET
ncbi:MAG: hypothetical protein JWP89_2835 [Schlesneria sp.]|nr:hypothetical protein [Schlesneria sp.]